MEGFVGHDQHAPRPALLMAAYGIKIGDEHGPPAPAPRAFVDDGEVDGPHGDREQQRAEEAGESRPHDGV